MQSWKLSPLFILANPIENCNRLVHRNEDLPHKKTKNKTEGEDRSADDVCQSQFSQYNMNRHYIWIAQYTRTRIFGGSVVCFTQKHSRSPTDERCKRISQRTGTILSQSLLYCKYTRFVSSTKQNTNTATIHKQCVRCVVGVMYFAMFILCDCPGFSSQNMHRIRIVWTLLPESGRLLACFCYKKSREINKKKNKQQQQSKQ